MRRFAVIPVVAASLLVAGCLNGGAKQSGVFVSRDGGASWQASPDLTNKQAKKPKVYPPLAVTAVAVSPADANTVVAGTEDELYLTTDGGKAWQNLTEKLPVENKAISVQAIRFHPTKPDTFFVGGVSAGYGKILKSTDKGGSLKDIFTVSRPGQTVTALLPDPNGSETLYAGDQLGAIYQSTDGGTIWRRVHTSESPISALTASGDSVYAATSGAGVLRSVAGGAFAPVSGNLARGQLTVWSLASGFGGLYAGTDEGLYLTRDFGASWQAVASPLPERQRVQAVVITGSAVYFATNAVVYRLNPSGDGFIPVQLQLARNVFSLAVTPADATVLYAGASKDAVDFGNRFGSGVPQLLRPPGDAN